MGFQDKNQKVLARIVKLNKKQERFCREYVIDNNGTQAAIRSGYSEAGAHVTASRLLNDVKVQDFIKVLQDEVNRELRDKYRVTQDRIMKERAAIAFFDPRNLYDEKGKLKKPADWDDETAAAIASVKEIAGGLEIRFWNKDGSLSALEKIEGMYEADNRQKNPYHDMSDQELADRLEKLRKKALA